MKVIWLLPVLALLGCTTTRTHLLKTNSLEGWESRNGGQWEIVDGVLSGSKDAAIPKHCILVTKTEYDNFTCSLEYKAIHGDSGFYFRLQPADNAVGFKGYHAEIRSDGKNAGGLFDVAVGWLHKPDPAVTAKAFKPGQWNTMTITAIDDDLRVTLNGHETTALKGNRTFRGRFGIQLHANENTQVKLRNITVTER